MSFVFPLAISFADGDDLAFFFELAKNLLFVSSNRFIDFPTNTNAL